MCGIFAVFNSDQAADLTYRGLHAQQHRAMEFAGIVTGSGISFQRLTGSGTVSEIFSKTDLDRLTGSMALGHIRYSTVEDSPELENAQPIAVGREHGFVALAHNGNLTNVTELKSCLDNHWTTSMDSEIILRSFYASQAKAVDQRVVEAVAQARGSYSLVFLIPGSLIAVQDESANRPLSLGQKEKTYFLASETCAFDAVEAKHIRDLKPGEILVISDKGLESYMLPKRAQKLAHCIFELAYYGHPSSNIFGESVARFRLEQGRQLEREHPVPGGEVVVPVPDSAIFTAQGYADSGNSGKFVMGITRSHYVGRTFIANGQENREARVDGKFQVVKELIQGTKMVLVDDSIVRLTTLFRLLKRIRQAGPKEIHVRIACPPITHSCHYGIYTPTRRELVAANLSVDQIRERLEVDSLEYLSMEAFRRIPAHPNHYCYACMTGNYPLQQ